MPKMNRRVDIKEYLDQTAPHRAKWKSRNAYYHKEIENLIGLMVPKGSKVLEIGCGTGELLNSVKPSLGVGVDISPKMVDIARRNFPHLTFVVQDAECFDLGGTFDYVILSDVIGYFDDVQQAFKLLHGVMGPRSRVVITYFNYLWKPILDLGERFQLKMPQPDQSWLSMHDIENLLYLSNFDVVKKKYQLLLPKYVPLLSAFCNKVLANLPIFWKMSLVQVFVAKPTSPPQDPLRFSCSVVIPTRNERNNIEGAIARTPTLGKHTELIFVDGNSSDGTIEEIHRLRQLFPDKDIKFIPQGDGRGKGDAVRKGFAEASGDILMILDADLTVPPEDLPKFFHAIVSGKGEFINGSRLVYPLERNAMRFLNTLGNKFFSRAFTFLIEQPFKDTLCGTKALWRSDYEKIVHGRSYFGDFDPFGDFDLIFGAAKLNLKIVEVPIRYRERVYGTTKISRFTHGWLLLKMCAFAARKIKFI